MLSCKVAQQADKWKESNGDKPLDEIEDKKLWIQVLLHLIKSDKCSDCYSVADGLFATECSVQLFRFVRIIDAKFVIPSITKLFEISHYSPTTEDAIHWRDILSNACSVIHSQLECKVDAPIETSEQEDTNSVNRDIILLSYYMEKYFPQVNEPSSILCSIFEIALTRRIPQKASHGKYKIQLLHDQIEQKNKIDSYKWTRILAITQLILTILLKDESSKISNLEFVENIFESSVPKNSSSFEDEKERLESWFLDNLEKIGKFLYTNKNSSQLPKLSLICEQIFSLLNRVCDVEDLDIFKAKDLLEETLQYIAKT